MSELVRIRDLYTAYDESLVAPWLKETEYPWQILPLIKDMIRTLIDGGLPGYTELEKDVWVGENVKIARTAVIEPPAIIGPNTEIRPGAYIRGNVLAGAYCVMGNSSEFKNCVLLDHVQTPHYNYIGDSILGSYSHTGAGSICSNLKSDGQAVVIHDRQSDNPRDYETGLRKIGAFLGDHADVGCGCVLNPGTVIGPGARIYPLTSVRGVIPGGVIVKSMNEMIMIEE